VFVAALCFPTKTLIEEVHHVCLDYIPGVYIKVPPYPINAGCLPLSSCSKRLVNIFFLKRFADFFRTRILVEKSIPGPSD
jgi:hypothetical protein